MSTTSLTQTQFEALVREAETLAKTSPSRYKLGILFYTLLGYLFIFGILFLLFSLAGVAIGSAFLSTALFLILLKKKLIFVLIPAIWILLKALWVRFDPPTGYVLKLKDYPVLAREIKALQARLKTIRVHQVILTPEFNAAVVQTPRLGIFGWYRNTLILGLELLLSLSPEQARAVLAHEFGHLSGNHSQFKGWIYRVRTTWDRITQAYSGIDSWGAQLMFKFFNWYSPRFSAYTFPLARMNEYEADAIAAQITSPQTVAEALVKPPSPSAACCIKKTMKPACNSSNSRSPARNSPSTPAVMLTTSSKPASAWTKPDGGSNVTRNRTASSKKAAANEPNSTPANPWKKRA